MKSSRWQNRSPGYATPSYQALVARYSPDGTRDNTFGENGVCYFTELPTHIEGIGLELLPNGKIISTFASLNEVDFFISQLQPNGDKDVAFGVNGIYQHTISEFKPRATFLDGWALTISGVYNTTVLYNQAIILRFLLDLNVGTLNPKIAVDPTLWLYPNPISEQSTRNGGGLLCRANWYRILFKINPLSEGNTP